MPFSESEPESQISGLFTALVGMPICIDETSQTGFTVLLCQVLTPQRKARKFNHHHTFQ